MLFFRRKLRVPEQFNRNSARVSALMPAEDSGRLLLDRMRDRIGFASYADVRLLDFGCGVRFTQAIVNRRLPIREYAGVDNYREMIEFLQRSVRDPRFSFAFLNARHPLYNPDGIPLGDSTRLPFAEGAFDVVSMFSVITHQNPDDAASIFRLLRRYVAPNGHLFFTCFLDEAIESFEDRSPQRNGGFCFYNPAFLTALVERCGWTEVNRAKSEGPLMGDSFVFRPS
ncbi:MAG: class I SAM-dependent methyltransferase [Acidobacteria bacterium]|nr:class I SAM-dependent methyltransferase [Acidobacteriota bacterium]